MRRSKPPCRRFVRPDRALDEELVTLAGLSALIIRRSVRIGVGRLLEVCERVARRTSERRLQGHGPELLRVEVIRLRILDHDRQVVHDVGIVLERDFEPVGGISWSESGAVSTLDVSSDEWITALGCSELRRDTFAIHHT